MLPFPSTARPQARTGWCCTDGPDLLSAPSGRHYARNAHVVVISGASGPKRATRRHGSQGGGGTRVDRARRPALLLPAVLCLSPMTAPVPPTCSPHARMMGQRGHGRQGPGQGSADTGGIGLGPGHNETPRGTAASFSIPTAPEASSWHGDRCKHRSRSLGFRGPSGQEEEYGPSAGDRNPLIHDFRRSTGENRASVHSPSTRMCVSRRRPGPEFASRPPSTPRTGRSSRPRRCASPPTRPPPPAAARRRAPA